MSYKNPMYTGTVATMWQDNNYKDFTDSLSRLLLYSSDNIGKIFYTTATVSYHELARKQLVDNAQGEWILMLDTDHAFGPDLLERLLFYKEQNKSRVISGIYQYKHPPHAPVANFWTPEGKLSPLVNWDRRGDIMEVGAVGAGCLLIETSVLREIKTKLKEDPFAIRPGLSEDYSFCQRCRDLGIPIDLALKVECHHIVKSPLSIQDYRAPQFAQNVTIENGKII